MNEEIIETDLIYLQQCGITRIRQMNSIGVCSLRDLLDTDENEIKQLPGVGGWHVERWKLQAEVVLNNQIMILKEPPDPNDFLYYDIETDTQQNLVWLIGTYNPKKDEFKQFLAKTPNEEEKILVDFIEYLEEQNCEKLCSYSASRFDQRVVQQRLGFYPIESAVFESKIDIDFGLEIRHMLLAKLQNYQLKTVGDLFMYPWTYKHEMGGFLVALTYERYQRDKNFKIDWNKLLEYNRDDVLVLPHIIKKMLKIYEESE